MCRRWEKNVQLNIYLLGSPSNKPRTNASSRERASASPSSPSDKNITSLTSAGVILTLMTLFLLPARIFGYKNLKKVSTIVKFWLPWIGQFFMWVFLIGLCLILLAVPWSSCIRCIPPGSLKKKNGRKGQYLSDPSAFSATDPTPRAH